MRPLSYSVLISNFNYAAYLPEAIESVLRQSQAAQEIIIVDDGSTDTSLQVLKAYQDSPRIKVIAQANGGQISAIASGLEAATGDIICLLDADDVYTVNYLSELNKVYSARQEIDFVFCLFEPFTEGIPPRDFLPPNTWLNPPGDYDYGTTALLTFFTKKWWIGNVTSTLSFRRKNQSYFFLRELNAVFKNPGYVDVPLLIGSSLNGMRKYFLNQRLVRYRFHAQSISNDDRFPRQDLRKKNFRYAADIYAHRVFEFYARKSCLSEKTYKFLLEEAALVPAPLPEHLKIYQKTYQVLCRKNDPPVSFGKKLELAFRKFRKGKAATLR